MLPHTRVGQKNTMSGSELMKGAIHAKPTCKRPTVLTPAHAVT